MANVILCIPPKIVDVLQQALKSGELTTSPESSEKKEFNLAELTNKKFTEQVEIFNKVINNKPVAEFIALELYKATKSKNKDAMSNWVKNTFYKSQPKIAKTFENKVNELYSDFQKLAKIKKADELKKEDLIKKIQQNEQQLIESFTSAKLGINVNAEEIAKITEMVDKINKLEKDFQDNLGDKYKKKLGKEKKEDIKIADILNNLILIDYDEKNPETSDFKYIINYLKIRKQINDYLYSINPPNAFARAISTGTGALLASIKSPIVNILGNISTYLDTTLPEILALNNKQLNSEYQKKLRDNYINKIKKIYKETGFDFTRAMMLYSDEKLWLGEKRFDKLLGTNWLTKYLKPFYEDVVFKYLMGYPDIIRAGQQFSLTLSNNIYAELKRTYPNISQEEFEMKFKDLFERAAAIEPAQKKIGKNKKEALEKAYEENIAITLRSMAVEAARVATFTNDTIASKIGLKLLEIIDLPFKALGLRGVAKLFQPFTKIPANFADRVLRAQILNLDGILKPIIQSQKIQNAFKRKEKEIILSQFEQAEISKNLLKAIYKAGITAVLGYLLYALFKPDDEEGMSYSGSGILTKAERQLRKEKGIGYNQLRMQLPGTNTIFYTSPEIFGILGGQMRFLGYLNDLKDSKTIWEMTLKYPKELQETIQTIPGIKNFIWMFNEALAKTEKIKEEQLEDKEIFTAAGKTFFDFVTARAIPTIFVDLLKTAQKYEQKNETTDFLGRFRLDAKPKLNMFGEKIEKWKVWFAYPAPLLFGSRMNFETKNKYTQELNRLNLLNELPVLSDIENISKYVQQLKKEMGTEKFEKLIADIGRIYKRNIDEILDSEEYKTEYKYLPEEQRKLWNQARTDAIEEAFYENDIIKEDIKLPKSKKIKR